MLDSEYSVIKSDIIKSFDCIWVNFSLLLKSPFLKHIFNFLHAGQFCMVFLFFQEYHQSVKQCGFRSGQALCQA